MATAPSEPIHPDTTVGFVAINTPDPERLSQFYTQVLGLQASQAGAGRIHLGAPGGREIVVLTPVEAVSPTETMGRKPTTGLFHFAILVPSRIALAQSLRRMVEAGWSPGGFSDHLVSEAIYLSDPEGNGIEVYRDRPRSEWPVQDGHIRMATEPLDIDGLLSELREEKPGTGSAPPAGLSQGNGKRDWPGMAPGTVLGHVHLKVADIVAAEAFYIDILGFDLVTRYGPSASFVSAGGYHHHIGFNTWSTKGAPPPPAHAPGLRFFTLRLPNPAALGRLVDHLHAANLPSQEVENGVLIRDPSENGILLTASPPEDPAA